VIIDLDKFIAAERPVWNELEEVLRWSEDHPEERLDLEQIRRLHYLYERTSADLGRITTFAAEPELRRYLESLVAQAYAEIHETREKQHRLAPVKWFLQTFPQTFRRQLRAFWLSAGITGVGVLFGVFAVMLDPAAKGILLPFGHGGIDPSERVRMEEQTIGDELQGRKAQGAAWYFQHNTKVSITTMALGLTWGVGTIVALFYNGIILGGICFDYVQAAQTKFLIAWLLPHGSVEIPAILIAGQAGLVLGGALIGWGRRVSLRERMRGVRDDLLTLILGVAVFLAWAGFVEAFFSQYHEPQVPYWVKIGFGTVELVLLALYLTRAGRSGGEAGVAAEMFGLERRRKEPVTV
jgi:uncharacterized membrane protein SpoIIM required for sporulation